MRLDASNRRRWLIALSILLVGVVVAIAMAAALAPTLLPSVIALPGMPERRSRVIFVGSYLALAIGEFPA